MGITLKNLYPPFSSSSQNIADWTATTETYLGQVAYSKATAWSGLSNILYLNTGIYTFSIYIRTSTSRPVSIYSLLGEGYPHYSELGTATPQNIDLGDITGDNAWHRYTFSFEVTQVGYFALRPEARSSVGTQMYIAAPQLEVGDTATDFEPYVGNEWFIPDWGDYPTKRSFPDAIESAFTEPVPTIMWVPTEDYPTKPIYLESVESAFTEPYPVTVWYEDENDNPNKTAYPTAIYQPFNSPYPASMWYEDENDNPNKSVYPEELETDYRGAFQGNQNIELVHIPRSCRKIGPLAFADTNLVEAVISKRCEFYPTSFPEGCNIIYWEDIGPPVDPSENQEDDNEIGVYGFCSYRTTTTYTHNEESTTSEIP